MNLKETVGNLAAETDEERGAWRREFIERSLRELELEYTVQEKTPKRQGTPIPVRNVEAIVGNPYRYLVIGCHYDRVPDSPGANDNGSGVAVALQLASRFKQNPTKKFGVAIVFFDQEEIGLLGSQVYVDEFDKGWKKGDRPRRNEGILALYNLDMIGIGDALMLWHASRPGESLVHHSIHYAARQHGRECFWIRKMPKGYASDHVPFRKHHLTALTITAAYRDEARRYSNLQSGDPDDARMMVLDDFYSRRDYHQPTDTPDKLDEGMMSSVCDIVFTAVHQLDSFKHLSL